MKKEIELYGRLKDAGVGSRVTLELQGGATAADALALLRGLLKRDAEGVVLATEDAVLSCSDRIPDSARLAALPPVCGG